MHLFRPMLAAKVADPAKLTYPLYASPKLDGIRATVRNGMLVSRTLKPIPNSFIRKHFTAQHEGLDGEIIVGDPTTKDVFTTTTSATMSVEGEPAFIFYAFDRWTADGTFHDRFEHLQGITAPFLRPLTHRLVTNVDELLAAEQRILARGFEGVILRSPGGTYKEGRSTLKEQGMLKLKRFSDSEAAVLDIVEEMHNANSATTDERGYTKRSSAKSGKQGKGRMGALVVRDLHSGVRFQIGSGFTEQERIALWNAPPLGRIVRYKFFEVGVKDAPRHPVFIGFRDPLDFTHGEEA